MAKYKLKVSGILGYRCMGAAVTEDVQIPVELSDEEVSALKEVYKGKKVRDIEDIKKVMPELYKRIYEEVDEQHWDFFERELFGKDIYFPAAFRKVD